MESFWPSCMVHLREQIKPDFFKAFIATSLVVRDEDGRIVVLAPNNMAARWLEQNIAESVRQFAQSHFGEELKVSFRERQPGDPEPADAALLANVAGAADIAGFDPLPPADKIKAKDSHAKSPRNPKTGLRTDLTFDNFVRGRANELAVLAAHQTAEGTMHSPSGSLLFFYGSSGMGKTHLAHAIGNRYLSLHPGRQVRYVMARNFMHEVINACRLDQHDQFKRNYSGLDMLIVDDIQYIGGDNKERTQEEFFFIFNQLNDDRKIIIITSDRGATQIRNMPSRLTSRFSNGLPAQLSPPEIELREAILKQKAQEQKVELKNEVIRFIAEKIKSNVRELEGALNRVKASARLLNKPPTLESCREALADLLDSGRESVTAEKIKKEVAQFYHLRVSDLSSPRRQNSITRPRHMAIHLCRKLTNMSLPEIGVEFNREHTTVLHSCRKMEKDIKTDSKLQEEERLITMIIKS